VRGAAAVAPEENRNPAVTAAAAAIVHVRMRRLCGTEAPTRFDGWGVSEMTVEERSWLYGVHRRLAPGSRWAGESRDVTGAWDCDAVIAALTLPGTPAS
jgi:hypothetical protein